MGKTAVTRSGELKGSGQRDPQGGRNSVQSWDFGVQLPPPSRRVFFYSCLCKSHSVALPIYGDWNVPFLTLRAPLPGSETLTFSRIYHLPFLPPVTPTFLLAHFLAPSPLSVLTPGRRPTLGNMVAMLLRQSRRLSSRSFCLSVQAFRRRSCRWSMFSRKT